MKPWMQLIVTRRGIVDINDITINDEVYTAKRRWRKVTAIKITKTNKLAKSTHSFFTPIGPKQSVLEYLNKTPYYVPRDKNCDNKNLNYWYTLGKKLSELNNLLESETFGIPINIILMDKKKCKAFLDGLFSGGLNYKNISKRARLGLSFMLKKQTWGYDYRSTYIVEKKNFTITTNPVIIKTLEVEEDNSYCVNGLYIYNK